ncbi:uncharacterized protein CTRU02_200448 [Colletotrichum truncatum]|uniref:Uncharacterized protein n=1 Tax=Colletotrichum truncatum TaxID=5467 RepID=A0ACC3ZF67_COLTU
MRILLARTVDKERLEHMISDPQNVLWGLEDVAWEMKNELGRAYDPCMRLIKDIGVKLETVAANLNIEGSEKIQKAGLEAVVSANPPLAITSGFRREFYFRKRVDFTMKQRSINKTLTEMEESNEKLRSLLEGADSVNSTQDDEDLFQKTRFMAAFTNDGVPTTIVIKLGYFSSSGYIGEGEVQSKAN